MPPIFWIVFGLLCILVIIQGFAFLEVLRQLSDVRQTLSAIQGPRELGEVSIGQPLPTLTILSAVDLAEVNLSQVIGEQPTALVFLHPGCSTCRTIAEQMAEVPVTDTVSDQVLAIVDARDTGEAKAFVERFHLQRLALVDPDGRVARELNVRSKPATVVISHRQVAAAVLITAYRHVHEVLTKEQVRAIGESKSLSGVSTATLDVSSGEYIGSL